VCVCASVCIQHTWILIYVLCMCVCVCVCVNNIIARLYSKNYCVITVSFVYTCTCAYNYMHACMPWVSACANSGALFLDYHTCAMLITVCFMYMYVCLRVQIYNARGLIFRLPYPVYHSLFHVYVYVSACT
jgi:hypothetical protein